MDNHDPGLSGPLTLNENPMFSLGPLVVCQNSAFSPGPWLTPEHCLAPGKWIDTRTQGFHQDPELPPELWLNDRTLD
jgi:hypothetical protein